MKIANCVCGHDRRDHRTALGMTRFGACKVCLCEAYRKPAAAALRSALISDESLAIAKAAALSAEESIHVDYAEPLPEFGRHRG